MAFHNPLQHLLRGLLAHRTPAPAPAPASEDFEDTRPAPLRSEVPRAAASRKPSSPRRPPAGWAESSIELARGTEIMEFPDDTAADLMDEFFAETKKRAA